ncbi:hypothetical protein BD309DRAFT_964482 [Dichomitus squalens]|nr:hypothetical protein BD309DRAFT_964482 [Dichomitus squalens]
MGASWKLGRPYCGNLVMHKLMSAWRTCLIVHCLPRAGSVHGSGGSTAKAPPSGCARSSRSRRSKGNRASSQVARGRGELHSRRACHCAS